MPVPDATRHDAAVFRTPRPLRLGTRGSRLALRQAEIVARPLRAAGVNVKIIELSTSGDRDLTRRISALPGRAPFADDIEQALLEGTIDAAVHSLKDLPEQPSPGLEIAAILPRAGAGEALVARGGHTLDALPPASVVGTSSPRRAAQLLARRPDLGVAPIRGPVEDRIQQVRDGHFAAAILALAGLQRLDLTAHISERLALEQFLPAPGQGALAVQLRRADAATSRACAALDDAATRAATTAELAFLRLARTADMAVAALATTAPELRLRARLLSLDGTRVREVLVAGTDPREVAQRAYDELCRSPLEAEHRS